MFKNLVLLSAVLIGSNVFSQSDPTIDAVYIVEGNNFCADGSIDNLIIVVTDADGDAITMDNIQFANGFLEYLNGPAPIVVGNTTTFTYYISYNGVTPPAVGAIENETVTINVSTFNGLDPTQVDSDVLGGLVVNGPVFVEFSNSNPVYCANGLPVDLSAGVTPAGGTFSWGYTWPGITSNSNVFNPTIAYKYYGDDGFDQYDLFYSVTNVNGCVGTANAYVSFNNPPEANISAAPSTCGGATGQAVASISNGQPPYEVYWSTGFSETVVSFSQITNLSSGVYYLNLEDANGCKNVIKANISDLDISVSPTIADSRCVGQNGSVALSITPLSGTVDEIFWSNGSTAPTLLASPGEYSVSIHTTTNCNYFGTYTILDSALRVSLDGLTGNSNCISGANGYIDITTIGGNGPYGWNWKKGGPTLYTSEDISGIDGGVYTCTVTDNNSCSLTWSKTIENYNNVWLSTAEVIKPNCNVANGSIDIDINYGGETPTVYSWSNGATSEDLTGIPAGNYTLTYADQSGCFNYLTVKLLNERPYQPTICLLTVDTSLIYNQIIWEKDITQDITGFNIYRETSVYGQFEKVSSRPYGLESFYEDNAASPIDRSWRYNITTTDACGGESYGSFTHKTIHVVSSTSDGTNYDLIWDDYEGISYSTVDVFRFDPTNGWTNIANLPYGDNTHVDVPPVIIGLDYMVSFNLSDPCTSSKAQDHNSSRSNKTASIFNPGGSTAQIIDEDLGYISIYPNPVSDMVTLHVDKPELFQAYEITNLNGQVISLGMIYSYNTSISTEDLAAGVYLVRIISADKIIVEKLVKN